jgi:hypothetical protein
MPENDRVRGTADAIVEQSASGVTAIVVGLASAPLIGLVPLPLPKGVQGIDGAIRTALPLLEEQAAEAVLEKAIGKIQGHVSKLVGMGLGRAKRLLVKILGVHKDDVVANAKQLVADGACRQDSDLSLVADLMARLFNEPKVIADGTARIASAGLVARVRREHRLDRLRVSNERWVQPVDILSHGLGHLWLVPLPLPIGPIPVAPVAGMVLLVWVVLISGDQLDSPRPVPDFWKGVVRRASGE